MNVKQSNCYSLASSIYNTMCICLKHHNKRVQIILTSLMQVKIV